MNQTQLTLETNETNLSGRWMTVIYNDDHTPMDLVVLTIMVATRCDAKEAEIETWEAHTYGKPQSIFPVKPNVTKWPA